VGENSSQCLWAMHASTPPPPKGPSRASTRLRKRKFTTNLSPYGKIRQVQKMTSCHHYDTIDLELNWISTAPGGAVLNKVLLCKSKGTWFKFKFAEKRSLEPLFSEHGAASFQGTNTILENPGLFAGISVKSQEWIGITAEMWLLGQEGVCCKVRIGKWVLVESRHR